MSVTHFNFSKKKNGNRYLFNFEWLAFKNFVFPMTTGAFGGKIQTYWILRFDGTCQFYCPFGRDNEWGAIFHYFYPKKGGLFQLCCEIEVFFKRTTSFLHLPIAFFGSHDCYLNNEIKLEELYRVHRPKKKRWAQQFSCVLPQP